MLKLKPATSHVRDFTVVARADGTPITSGTVNHYLVALTGANAGKWFRNSDQSWQASETVCQALTHKADGHWYAGTTIHADAWIQDVEYLEYIKESGDLHVPVSRSLVGDSTIEGLNDPTAAAIADAVLDEALGTHSGALAVLYQIAEGDTTIDTTTTPWQLVIKKKSTDTELVRKDLKEVDDTDVTAVDQIVGKQEEP